VGFASFARSQRSGRFRIGALCAGKTHTLMGSAAEPGLMILAMADLFSMCDEKKTHEFLARMSYVREHDTMLFRTPARMRKRSHTSLLARTHTHAGTHARTRARTQQRGRVRGFR
jgi:hypothetical protein